MSEETTIVEATHNEKNVEVKEDENLDQEILDSMGGLDPENVDDEKDEASKKEVSENDDSTKKDEESVDDNKSKAVVPDDADAQKENVQTVEDDATQQSEEIQSKPSRLDQRIVQLAIDTAAESGESVNVAVVQENLQNMPRADRERALRELLAQKHGGNSTEMDSDDLNLLAEERAEQILAERDAEKSAIAQGETESAWHTNLAQLIKENPVLDETSSQYNKSIAGALEIMLVSGEDARYDVDPLKAFESLSATAQMAQDDAERVQARKRHQSMNGAMSGSGDVASPEGWTLEKLEKLEEEDPEEYDRVIQKIEIPNS